MATTRATRRHKLAASPGRPPATRPSRPPRGGRKPRPERASQPRVAFSCPATAVARQSQCHCHSRRLAALVAPPGLLHGSAQRQPAACRRPPRGRRHFCLAGTASLHDVSPPRALPTFQHFEGASRQSSSAALSPCPDLTLSASVPCPVPAPASIALPSLALHATALTQALYSYCGASLDCGCPSLDRRSTNPPPPTHVYTPRQTPPPPSHGHHVGSANKAGAARDVRGPSAARLQPPANHHQALR